MRKAPPLLVLFAALFAAVLSVFAAYVATLAIEARTSAAIRRVLANEAITWADVSADGLLISMTGTAPSEAMRFRALSLAGTVTDASRVIDNMDVTPPVPIDDPEFALELLRNDAGVTMIGLIPTQGEFVAQIMDAVGEAAPNLPVTNMLDSADFPAPEQWDEALAFGLKALNLLPRSKISVAEGEVTITAIADSAATKRRYEDTLLRDLPDGVEMALDISAPRPVITPFTLRFVKDAAGARFDACSAETDAAHDRILAAARAAGAPENATCRIGLGVPTPDWAAAVETAINTVDQLGGGTVTFSDADVSLVGLAGTDAALFDRAVGELESALHDLFSLHADLPEPVSVDGTDAETGPPEFIATKSPEGLVQLRGRVTDDLVATAAESYARARFGLDKVYAAMRMDDTLPDGWSMRVLAALEGLSELANGVVVVQPEFVELRGTTNDPEARDRIAQSFAAKLGENENYAINVEFVELEEIPEDESLTPEQCVARINDVQSITKITFGPGVTSVEGDSLNVVDKIAEILRECPDAQIEVGGHTDNQGSEGGNQSLSQQRANAVVNALAARRILVSNLTAVGYGETTPIADNSTEEGREANRRIEFRLMETVEAEPDIPENTEGAPTTDAPADEQGSGDAEPTTDDTQTDAAE